MQKTVWTGLVVLALSFSVGCAGQKAAVENSDVTAMTEQAAVQAAEEQKKSSETFESRFTDLTDDVPTKEYITDLEQLKVFEGVSSEFKPYEPLTRGEYVTWLFQAYNAIREDKVRLAPPGTPSPFKDLSTDHPSFKYVAALANAGYSVGYEDGTFKPDQPITREEMIAMKYGVDRNENKTADSVGSVYNAYFPFVDKNEVDKRYRGNLYYDVDDKNAGGNCNSCRAFGATKNFKPKAPVMRHEGAATLWQMDRWGNASAEKVLAKEDGAAAN